MSKVRVAIDTSALRSDAGLSSGPMEALARFAEKGHVEILIPSVVAGEFTTKPSAKIESMAELRKTLKTLKQNVSSNLHPTIAQFETRISEAFGQLRNFCKQRFATWQTRTHATIVESSAEAN